MQGMTLLNRWLASSSVDVVIAAIVGYSGVRPTIAAIKAGKKIALANKETLVVAGEIIGKNCQRLRKYYHSCRFRTLSNFSMSCRRVGQSYRKDYFNSIRGTLSQHELKKC